MKKIITYMAVVFAFIALGILIWYCINQKEQRQINGIDGLPPATIQLARACSLNGNCINDVVLIQGQFTMGTKDVINSFLNNNNLESGQSTVICFDSPGGSNQLGKALGEFISNNGYSTCIAEQYFTSNDGEEIPSRSEVTECISMCPYVFMAGHERIFLGTEIQMGFHSSKMSVNVCGYCVWSYDNESESEELRQLLKLYEQNNSPAIQNVDKLISGTFDIPSEKVGLMTMEQIVNFNIVTVLK